MRVRPRLILDYVALALIWGSSFVLVLRVVDAFGWVAAVTLRALAASAILRGLAGLTRRRLVFGAWRHLAAVGATTVAGQLIGLSLSTALIGTAMAAIFVGTIPLFSMVIGHAWGIEQLTAWSKAGLVVGFAGVVLLIGFPAVPVDGRFVVGCTLSVGGAVSAALGSNYARRHLRDIGSWEQTTGAFAVGGAMLLPLLVAVPVPRRPTAGDVLSLIALAGVCSALAYVLYFRLVAEVGATIAISVEFLVTVVAVAIGAAVLKERLSAAQVAGGVLILTGCALVLGLAAPRSPHSDTRRRADETGDQVL